MHSVNALGIQICKTVLLKWPVLSKISIEHNAPKFKIYEHMSMFLRKVDIHCKIRRCRNTQIYNTDSMNDFLFIYAFREEDIVIAFSGHVRYPPGSGSLHHSQLFT
jgi:hypothetical protein